MRPVNWSSPVNRGSALARGLRSWWIIPPQFIGGTTLFDILRRGRGVFSGLDLSADWQPDAHLPWLWSVEFPDADDKGLVPRADLDMSSGEITVAGWVKVAVWASNGGPFGQWGGGVDPRWVLWTTVAGDANTIEMLAKDSGGTSISSGEATGLPTAEWLWIGGTYALDNKSRVYHNGDLKSTSSGTGTGGLRTTGGDLSIGKYQHNAPGTGLDMKFSELMYYTRALSESEMQALYVESLTGYPTLLNRARRRAFTLVVELSSSSSSLSSSSLSSSSQSSSSQSSSSQSSSSSVSSSSQSSSSSASSSSQSSSSSLSSSSQSSSSSLSSSSQSSSSSLSSSSQSSSSSVSSSSQSSSSSISSSSLSSSSSSSSVSSSSSSSQSSSSSPSSVSSSSSSSQSSSVSSSSSSSSSTGAIEHPRGKTVTAVGVSSGSFSSVGVASKTVSAIDVAGATVLDP